ACFLSLFCTFLAWENEEPSKSGSTPGEAELRWTGLTLDECVLKAYEHNISLKNSRQALDSRETFIGEANGRFDPEFFIRATGAETITPTSTSLDRLIYQGSIDASDVDTLNMATGFTGTLLSGATYTLDLQVNHYFDPASRDFLQFDPIYSNGLGIEIRQPLLKGGWTGFNRVQAVKAGLNTQSEALSLETNINEVLFNTIEAYWNLVFANEDVKAKEKSLELAKDLLQINTRKKEEGVFSKLEVLEASAEVAMKKEQLITARNSVLAAEDAVKRLILPFDQTSEWNVRITTLTVAEEVKAMEYDMDTLISESMEYRSEMKQQQLQLKNMEMDVVSARNQLLPSLDVTGSYRFNAIGSNVGNSFNDIEKRKYRSFSVGMEFACPLGNRIASNVLRRAEIEYQRSLTTLKELEVQIVYEIRDAVREITLQREKLAASEESWRLSWERYDGEKKRLEAGISISYQVREAERNLLTETVNRARSLLDYQIALARLEKAKGTLLTKYDIPAPEPCL
ncbi:MAG: TolC family protein, partial [Planctomycetota bacterium]